MRVVVDFFYVLLLFICLCYRCWQCHVHKSKHSTKFDMFKQSVVFRRNWIKKNNNYWLKQHEFHSNSKYQCVSLEMATKNICTDICIKQHVRKNQEKKIRIYFLPSIDFFLNENLSKSREKYIYTLQIHRFGAYTMGYISYTILVSNTSLLLKQFHRFSSRSFSSILPWQKWAP